MDFHKYLQSLEKHELIAMIHPRMPSRRALSAASHRTIALRMSYDGQGYSGMAPQHGKRTVGEHLLHALRTTGLGDSVVYAGRTDAGVSAVNMVVSAVVISRLNAPNRSYSVVEDDHREYRYDLILNSHLPPDIRVTGWAPAPDTFSARFTCVQRQYRYYFHKEGLDLCRMNEAALRIKGMRNFYSLSKHSDAGARYERTVDECRVVDDGDMFYLDIRARAFLHNMVRKIMWVVQRVGRGEEFSLERVGIADPTPLVFSGAAYPTRLAFIGNHRDREAFLDELRTVQTRHKISAFRLQHFNSSP